MPPPTSRASPQPPDSSARPNTPPSYLSALRQLESPVSPQVINLAATLTTQAENEVDEDNVSFLRRPIDPQEEWRQQNAQAEDELFEEVRAARDRLRARTAEMQSEDRDRQMRLTRVLNRLSRMEDALPYSDRVPLRNSINESVRLASK
ncbi:vacuolar import degradation protein vid24 [Neofusicoccum parvum]|uniref:Vacuolar import degradation protein vid24 n=1 Tax=Neofusicoccum parvum TaxID=310453 RepID=A0ACB5RXM6_9PEZI|nr:vacuolar import degradation protein vid24 [Neofusicoccum parvum]GME53818.1 vacuolar import degradation protein vid24 [Neofusicoccum parvum]